ncbi:MAG: antibiotic biosynthesis monooxygenase [Gemmatimonadetes bacterium]|nr:antibiotic biosynthesis monooxygenase [Gemmatimonadota bacterium]
MDYQHNPFVLIARITVTEGKVSEYMVIAKDADNAVNKSEPGMLLHNFDADPNDKHKFVWTEVYRNSADFLFHADNPPVQDYVNKHAELADHFSIEIYGNVSCAVIDKIEKLGIPLVHFKNTGVGYVRSEYFS